MRLSSILALGLGVTAVLVLNLTVALADGWFWNAQVDIEGVQTRTVWSVTDDPDGADDYRALILVAVPRGADARVVDQLTEDERVRITRTARLSCTEDGVEVMAQVLVHPKQGAGGSAVQFDLVADDNVVASTSGSIRQPLSLRALLETDGNHSC